MDDLPHPGSLIDDDAGIAALLARTRTIAVVGIKTEAERFQPAFYVPEYMAAAGFEIVPVPVYYPEVKTILGRRVYRSLRDLPQRVDLVNMFRRAADIPPHVDDILAARPRAVWFQSGIRHDVVAARLARAGIDVVQDRCLMVEHRRHRTASRS
jgi:predicted CoA-binding protein